MKNASLLFLTTGLLSLSGPAAWSQVGLVTPAQVEDLQKIQEGAKAAAQKPRFIDIMDEVYQGKEPSGADLSAASPTDRFAVSLHVEYRDEGAAEFQDYKGKPESYIEISPRLVALDPFWSGQVQNGDQVLSQMEGFYYFDFKVEGMTLRYRRIFQEMHWPRGQTPIGREMDVVGYIQKSLEPGQTEISTFRIGKREYRVSFGFLSKPR